MLTEIVGMAISDDPGMCIVSGQPPSAEIGAYTRRKHIDALIFISGDKNFDNEVILGLLRVNPRLCLLGLDGLRNRAIVHRLTPVHENVDDLAAASLVSALHSGTALRLG